MYCVFNKEKKAYTYLICIFCGLLPSVCCAYCYGKIFYKTYQIKCEMSAERTPENIATKIDLIKLATTLCYSYTLYALCW